MKTTGQRLIATVLLFGLPAVFAADEIEEPYLGEVEIGTTLTALADIGNSMEAEGGMAFDVLTIIPTRAGAWGLLIEASIDPISDQISNNGQPGENNHPWDPVHGGEARLAELHYGFSALGGDWSIGLMDSRVHIDGSVVANDD